MKKVLIPALSLLTQIFSTNLQAANAPIQQIDIANLLANNVGGSGGATETAVNVAFLNGGALPCYTTTLAYQAATSIRAGIGQTCQAPITSITLTPIANSNGLGTIYETPLYPVMVDSRYYSTQITISQNTAPTFDPNNGNILLLGTIQTTVVNHLGRPEP
ncbi:hypothetical protein [Legionella cherrii]|uniref:Uncharacterized protein n=1 Tax=Legionella cherrii TaxID=28084 RepID=A0A0W0S6Q6_9GAMM|nr:hypothetical protein [Legionella cherrii]KTC79110.1 hypothetical protein Lche_1130 [Legionella cherrii]VEB36570.1 Uncharacterised protein [Legionella cherrii]